MTLRKTEQGVRDVVQQAECQPQIYKAWVQYPDSQDSVVVQACDPSTQEVGVSESEVHSHPPIQSLKPAWARDPISKQNLKA